MKLLLAEDEPSLARALKVILEKNFYTVEVVDNGADALDYLLIADYDCAILDIMMPKMDGLTVLKEVRKQKKTLPVLMLTAKSEIDDRVAGLDSGANDYLTKPFDPKELLARIRAMTRSFDAADSHLSFGNTVLNRSTGILRVHDRELRLANKEYQILELFLSRPGHIISADQLFDKVWDADSEADISTVWVHISNIRKKISAMGSDIQIRAVRGSGYVLEKGGESL